MVEFTSDELYAYTEDELNRLTNSVEFCNTEDLLIKVDEISEEEYKTRLKFEKDFYEKNGDDAWLGTRR